MGIELRTAIDEHNFEIYRSARNQVRDTMANGVYPNCIAAQAAYDLLESRLAEDLSGYAAYHGDIMSKIAPHVASIRAAMDAITDTMEAIERAQPGTFGIQVPENER